MTERPIAHWIDDFGNILQFDEKRDSPVGGSAYCSNCGEWLVGSDEYSCHGSFCPHCGAEMKGQSKEGDPECFKEEDDSGETEDIGTES